MKFIIMPDSLTVWKKELQIVQQQVMQARSKMNWFENKFLEKTLEVQKV